MIKHRSSNSKSTPLVRIGPSQAQTSHPAVGQSGMVLVMALVFLVGLMMAAISVANIGMMAAEKVRVQNTVDSAAYSAAVMEARAMNLTAYVNRAMVANYNSIAFNMALWATVDAYDHGSAAAAGTLYFLASILAWNPVSKAVADVGKGIDRGFHRPMHSFNRSLKSAFEEKDLNKYIEQYNTDVLSMYQGIVFAATQQVRHKVMQSVAKEMDPTVSFDTTVSLAVESSNADELIRALDYVVGDPSRSNSLLSQLNRTFNNMAGSSGGPQGPVFLGAVSEASLDRFAAGRLRTNGKKDFLRNMNTGNFLTGSWIDIFLDSMKAACYLSHVGYCANPLHWGSCPYTCYADFDLNIGGNARPGNENSFRESRVPVIDKNRVREVNSFGINGQFRVRISHGDWVDFGQLLGGSPNDDGYVTYGYTSGKWDTDIGNYKNSVIGAPSNRKNQCYPSWMDNRFWQAIYNVNPQSCVGPNANSCSLGKVNACLAANTGFLNNSNWWTSDPHFDGNFSDPAAQALNYVWGNLDWPTQVQALITYNSNMIKAGLPYKASNGTPAYQLKTSLRQVGIMSYTYPHSGAQLRATGNSRNQAFMTGPTVAAVGVKPAEVIRGIRMRGIYNTHPITAMARAQVYYKQNPNRSFEQPNVFNPHWGARLAPIDSGDTPIFIRRSVPFVTSGGITMAPTH